MSTMTNAMATAACKSRYNRIAPLYDRMHALSERNFRCWRQKLWSQARGKILEVGVGTGKNVPFYPSNVRVTGIDLSDKMLARVVKPEGRILLLEHVRVDHPVIGAMMDLINPLVARLIGANINRRTVENVKKAGLEIESIEHLGPFNMVKLIIARVSD